MKANVSEYEFRDTILKLRPDNFSYAGLTALYEYLIELEESMGYEILFDPIGICCEYTEYDSIDECLRDYSLETVEELEKYTEIIMVRSDDESAPRVIIQNF